MTQDLFTLFPTYLLIT